MRGATALLALADGSVFPGRGFGAEGVTVGELCFNTAMTGYQEVLTDPSYADQIVLFTFPHIGNVGVNREDDEAEGPVAAGMVTRESPTEPSNWRSRDPLADWLRRRGRIGIAGVDTRALTRRIRTGGMPHAAILHQSDGTPDADTAIAAARRFPGIQGAELARRVSRDAAAAWGDEARWTWRQGFRRRRDPHHRVAVLDYGAKRNILRSLTESGCRAEVLPADAGAGAVLATRPDGVFLSNGPGDPAATGVYATAMIRAVLARRIPVFGICLGHQLLGLALGARTVKMRHGHHGANHPVRDLETGRVAIVSMNHGFAIDRDSLPDGVAETHRSLFDGSNCGLRAAGGLAFSVQFHPEASPGPQDSLALFDRFAALMDRVSGGGAGDTGPAGEG